LLCHIQMRIDEGLPNYSFDRIFNGSGAVTFFFVLSGLVVGAALAKHDINYTTLSLYLHRRFFRIMPLLFVTVTIGGLYLLFIDELMRFSLYDRAYGNFSLAKFLSAYIGYSLKPNQPIWSIYIEIIASLLIPLMILSGSKFRYVLLTLVVCVAFSLVNIDFQHHWNFYMISFYIGLSILIWGKALTRLISGLPKSVYWLLVATLFMLFYLARLITNVSYGDLWIVYWETATIAPLVAMIYYMPEKFSLLNKRAFIFLGDISYSLYLTHWILLAIALNYVTAWFGTGELALITFCTLSIVVSLLVATVSFHTIEMGGAKLGEALRQSPKPIQHLS
jgi:peptidoglycan/LPS O-acetylase OafA/YrhL